MRLLRFHLCMLLVLLGFTSGLSSCNPVKQVLRDPQKFAQVRDTVFARGLCLNDTVTTEVTRDTVIYRDVLIPSQSAEVTPSGTCEFDTYVDGNRVHYANGKVTLTLKPQKVETQLKTVVKTNTVRDKARESVLEKQLSQAQVEKQNIIESAKERQQKLIDQNTALKLQVANRGQQRLVLLFVIAGLGLFAFRKPLAALII